MPHPEEYVANRVFLASPPAGGLGRTRAAIGELGRLEPIQGYACAHYGGAYFTRTNAGLIDACREALTDLLSHARARHIFLSYNSEGILPKEWILEVFRRRGRTTVYQKDYGIFRNGAGRSVKRTVKERLFHCPT